MNKYCCNCSISVNLKLLFLFSYTWRAIEKQQPFVIYLIGLLISH